MKNINWNLKLNPILFILFSFFVIQSCSTSKKTTNTNDKFEEVEVVYFQDKDPSYIAPVKTIQPEVKKEQNIVEIEKEKEKVEQKSVVTETKESIKTAEPTIEKKVVVSIPTTQTTSVKNEAIETKAKKEVKVVLPPAKKVVKTTKTPIIEQKTQSITAQESFFLIAGSFKSRINAEALVELLKKQGFKNAYIHLNEGDFRRVVVQGFDNEIDAKEFTRIFKKNHPEYKSAWLMH